jgi:hemoglobin
MPSGAVTTVYEAVGGSDGRLRAIACCNAVLVDAGLAAKDRSRRALRVYFAWAPKNTMSPDERSPDDVPDGLRIPRWSWDGLLSGTGPEHT